MFRNTKYSFYEKKDSESEESESDLSESEESESDMSEEEKSKDHGDVIFKNTGIGFLQDDDFHEGKLKNFEKAIVLVYSNECGYCVDKKHKYKDLKVGDTVKKFVIDASPDSDDVTIIEKLVDDYYVPKLMVYLNGDKLYFKSKDSGKYEDCIDFEELVKLTKGNSSELFSKGIKMKR